jgi:hypothetical protein
MKFRHWLIMNEAAYKGNIGAVEMMKFYQIASKDEIRLMEALAKKNDWNGFKKLIQKVLGVKLS